MSESETRPPEWLIEVYGTGQYRCYQVRAWSESQAFDVVAYALRQTNIIPPYLYRVVLSPPTYRPVATDRATVQ